MKNNIGKLLTWYRESKRALPWRENKDPYSIWLSEIILQQTRVEQGLPYYLKIIDRYPTVIHLADASEQDVLKMWQGLGYYSRARNMLKCAKVVKEQHNGIFPNDFQSLLALPGIGDYTASAIASIAFSEKTPVVDGNVFRVISRWFNLEDDIAKPKTKKIFKDISFELMDKHDPGTYNQALMELGAMVCTPKSPNCIACIVHEACEARANDSVALRPVKSKQVKVKDRSLDYHFLTDGGYCLVRERVEQDIWKGLYEFVENDSWIPNGKKEGEIRLLNTKKMQHLLTHRRLLITIKLYKMAVLPQIKGYQKVKLTDLQKYPVPKPLEKFISELDDLLA